MLFYVYILECADNSLYVGCTNNLGKRFEQHNESKWEAHYTKIRRPVILKHSEEFKTLKEARHRESEIKGWRREKKLFLIEGKKDLLKIANLPAYGGFCVEKRLETKEEKGYSKIINGLGKFLKNI